MADPVSKIVKPTAEFLEDIARKIPQALGKGHHNIGTDIHDAADVFEDGDKDLATAARDADKVLSSGERDIPGEGTREVSGPYKPNTQLGALTSKYSELSAKARILARSLARGPVDIKPGEVSTLHLGELQKFHLTEVAIIQGPAGDLKLIAGEAERTVIPEELASQGYKFIAHTHPEDYKPGIKIPGLRNSMTKDLNNKKSPHIEVVINRHGEYTFFDNNGILDLPPGTIPRGGPLNPGGFIIPIPRTHP